MAKRLKNKLKNIEELEQKFSENVEMCFRDDSAYYKLKQKLKEFLDALEYKGNSLNLLQKTAKIPNDLEFEFMQENEGNDDLLETNELTF
jgi:hypothetical protein